MKRYKIIINAMNQYEGYVDADSMDEIIQQFKDGQYLIGSDVFDVSRESDLELVLVEY